MLRDKTNIVGQNSSIDKESQKLISKTASGASRIVATPASPQTSVFSNPTFTPATQNLPSVIIHQHDLLLRFQAFHGCMQVCSAGSNPSDAEFRKYANYFVDDGFRNLRRALELDSVFLSPPPNQKISPSNTSKQQQQQNLINVLWSQNHQMMQYQTDSVLNVLCKTVVKDKNCKKLVEKLKKEEGCEQVMMKVSVGNSEWRSSDCICVLDIQQEQILHKEQLTISKEVQAADINVEIWNEAENKIIARGCIALDECRKTITSGFGYRAYTPDMQQSSKQQPILMRNLCSYMNVYHSIQLPLSLDAGHVIVEVPCNTGSGKDIVIQLEIWEEQCTHKFFQQGLHNGVLFVPGSRTIQVSVITVQEVFEIIFKTAIKVCECSSRKLKVSFEWQWMLSRFSQFFNLREQYTLLSYLRWLTLPEIWTPTGHYLTTLSDNIKKVKNLHTNGDLQTTEIYIFEEIQKDVLYIIQYTVENFKFLSVENQSGISSKIDMNVEDPEALHSGMEIFSLLMNKENGDDQDWLIDAFKKGAEMAFQNYLHEITKEYSQSVTIEDATLLIAGVMQLIQHDQQIHQHHILPDFMELPKVTSPIYTTNLRSIVIEVLKENSESSSNILIDVIEHLGKLEMFLQAQQLEALDVLVLVQPYYDNWLKEVEEELDLFVAEYGEEDFGMLCSSNQFPQSHLSQAVPSKLIDTMTQLSIIIQFWPSCLQSMEQKVCSCLRKTVHHILTNTGINRTLDLTGWEWDVPQRTLYRQTAIASLYQVEAILLNSLYEFLSILPTMEKKIRAWITDRPSVEQKGGSSSSHKKNTSLIPQSFGMYFKGVFQELRSLYSFTVLETAARMQRSILSDPQSNIVSILGYQQVTDLEYIRSILQPTMEHIEDAISVLKEALKTPILIACLRALWDCFGSCLLQFAKANEADWIKGQNVQLAAQIIDSFFVTAIKTLLAQNVQPKDLDFPKNVQFLQALFAQSMETSYRVV